MDGLVGDAKRDNEECCDVKDALAVAAVEEYGSEQDGESLSLEEVVTDRYDTDGGKKASSRMDIYSVVYLLEQSTLEISGVTYVRL